MLKETFTDAEIEELIEDNKQLVAIRGDSFGVNNSELSNIFSKINNFDQITNFKDRIIRKTAWILGGISFHQPFNDGNKEMAVSLAIYFLREKLERKTHTRQQVSYNLLRIEHEISNLRRWDDANSPGNMIGTLHEMRQIIKEMEPGLERAATTNAKTHRQFSSQGNTGVVLCKVV